MGLYKYYPLPSDRMGALWTLLPIKDSCILEFGTSGTTRFELNSFAKMQGDQNSKIFSTHLDETDIAMGDVSRLDKALDEIIESYNPPVIFIMPSTLSATMGTDIVAHCKEYQKKYVGTKIIPITSDGFNGNWNTGIMDTLNILATYLPIDTEKSKPITYNIIGSCADDYNYYSDSYEIQRILKEGFDATPNCIMTSDTHISDFKSMGASHVNIVLRNEGISAAQTLEKRFGTPFILGRPYGLRGTLAWLKKISEILKTDINNKFITFETYQLENALGIASSLPIQGLKISVALGGHVDVVKGLKDFLKNEAGFKISHAWCNSPDMSTEDIPFYKENEWENLIKEAEFNILMGNAITLKLARHDCTKIQIDNPNYEFSFLKYPYTPYVGFRGALYLLTKCINP
ncbi:nitrogenase component 1 [Clostridium estertheticum]|uniref:nitrogenase component 1 n=1 Tax=Clostridium estertheticum TaxID=238834 RepID=UPI001C7CE0BA|nr:nitrogenase component 1 [Clostridium estertheticum]MBX4261376.1 nitrogenase component 1 [Clostridium estertheticum]WLC70654.1 nitrogenase component 1 [Clostridium estertheticum]